jgi:raffinose/stachyose/melibiose transport system permease protein
VGQARARADGRRAGRVFAGAEGGRAGRVFAGAEGGPADRPPGEPRRVAYLYVAPAFVAFALFVLAPLAHSAWISLFAWDGVTVGEWVGLENYRALVTDAELRAAFGRALVLLAFYAVLPVVIGLALAGALARTRVRGLTALRTILFLPQVVALVVVAVTWRMIYAPEGGLINETLRTVGAGYLAQDWLGSFDLALPAVGVIGTWVMYGLAMVLLTAGVQKIPQSLYDAARVDGAGPVREFLAVTLPGVRNEVAVALTLTTIAALRTFDLVYLTTGGGPGDATSVPAFEVYERAFRGGEVGAAAAIGICLAAVIFLLAFLIDRVAEREGRR